MRLWGLCVRPHGVCKGVADTGVFDGRKLSYRNVETFSGRVAIGGEFEKKTRTVDIIQDEKRGSSSAYVLTVCCLLGTRRR